MYPRKTKKRGPVKKFQTGRVCKKQGCTKKLSVYNSEDYCYVHTREMLR